MLEDTVTLALLFDCFGQLLTEKQRVCFDLYYNQDFSLAEIAQEVGISRQGVHDTLMRAETALRNMEDKTGCVSRQREMEQALAVVRKAAVQMTVPGADCSALAQTILDATDPWKEQ